MNVLEQHELITVDMDEDANELYLDQKGRMPFEVGQTGTVVYDSDKITISTLGRTMEAVATVINIMDSSRKVIVELEDGCQMTLEYHEFLRRGEWCYAIDEENYIEYKGPQRGQRDLDDATHVQDPDNGNCGTKEAIFYISSTYEDCQGLREYDD
jgi:hypothetical protein